MNYREIILHLVNTNQGLKAVDLVLKVMSELNPLKFNGDEFYSELEKLVEEGEIVELEYTLSQLDYRVKSIYFPKGTKIER